MIQHRSRAMILSTDQDGQNALKDNLKRLTMKKVGMVYANLAHLVNTLANKAIHADIIDKNKQLI